MKFSHFSDLNQRESEYKGNALIKMVILQKPIYAEQEKALNGLTVMCNKFLFIMLPNCPSLWRNGFSDISDIALTFDNHSKL